jgi:threonine dehydratase
MDAGTKVEPLTSAAVEQAAAALRKYLEPTPLQYSRAFTGKAACHVHLKVESIQPTRAFKVRGALNKLIGMHSEERSAGVITASAGNHGLGVAHAAQAFGVPATVCVPDNANRLKVEAMKMLGARVVHFGRSYQEASQEAARMQSRTGATLVHAYDDADVIAGQGSVAVEMLEQLPEFDTVLVPVGGGGLISGMAIHLKARRPSVRVIGVEPTAAGRPVTLGKVSTIADGLAASAPGALTLEIAARCVDRMIRVEESEMLRAIRLLFEWEHLLAEPSGAATMAALLYHYAADPGERVVVVLSGGNVSEEVMVRALTAR